MNSGSYAYFENKSSEDRLRILQSIEKMDVLLTSTTVSSRIKLGKCYKLLSDNLNRKSRRAVVEKYLTPPGKTFDNICRTLQVSQQMYSFWRKHHLTIQMPIDSFVSIMNYTDNKFSDTQKGRKEAKNFIIGINKTRNFNGTPLTKTKKLRESIKNVQKKLPELSKIDEIIAAFCKYSQYLKGIDTSLNSGFSQILENLEADIEITESLREQLHDVNSRCEKISSTIISTKKHVDQFLKKGKVKSWQI